MGEEGLIISAFVMPRLGPGIHDLRSSKEDVVGRAKPGHDVDEMA
jgi:hypothetical protein